MKILGFVFGLFLIGFNGIAQESEGITITVTVENVLNDNGKVLAGLHTEATFMKGDGIATYMGEAAKGEMTFTFENVAPGTYGISVMHDENGNMRMDFEDTGMPKESYGMSNNVMAMGPPTFEDCKFEVTDKDVALSIRF